MIEEIKIFILVLSVFFSLNHLIKFIMVFTQKVPTPITLGVTNKILLYFSMAYIVTTIITAIIT